MKQNGANGMRAILIGGDGSALRLVAEIVRDLGLAPDVTRDARSALDKIDKDGLEIAICDLHAEPWDGFEFLRRVKESRSACDVILLVADGEKDAAIRALREGATDFIERPVNRAAVQAAIERTTRFRAVNRQQRLLTDKIAFLNSELTLRSSGSDVMVGTSPAMRKVAQEIVDYADSGATVLILGESGTGKEVIAKAIHQTSARRNEAFLTINCSSVAENLFEAEMFGHRRGSYTGAIESRGGYVEAAQGGTLFLDEIGDLPVGSQAKILRLVEQKTYVPVGESKERRADIRIIAATNQPIEKRVEEKRFRLDLYYRLTVCSINAPPLRERKDDLPLLALFFTLRFAAEMGKALDGIDDEALAALGNYDFPGNVRELRNIIERSVIRCKHTGLIALPDLPDLGGPPGAEQSNSAWPLGTLCFAEVERRLYETALRQSANNVSAAARVLGLERSKLRRRLKTLKIG